jgi:hypothetical protein
MPVAAFNRMAEPLVRHSILPDLAARVTFLLVKLLARATAETVIYRCSGAPVSSFILRVTCILLLVGGQRGLVHLGWTLP